MHARQLRAHVDALAARRYPTAFRPAAPFTVLFVPSDGFLTTALEAEPGLLEYGFARDVVLATPSTLLALLRTVAYSWRQERLARDADQVLEVGRRLHARLSTLSGHLTRLGSALGTTMTRFNETVGSYERSVLTAARRFDDLGIAESPVPEPAPVEATVRALRPAEPRLGTRGRRRRRRRHARLTGRLRAAASRRPTRPVEVCRSVRAARAARDSAVVLPPVAASGRYRDSRMGLAVRLDHAGNGRRCAMATAHTADAWQPSGATPTGRPPRRAAPSAATAVEHRPTACRDRMRPERRVRRRRPRCDRAPAGPTARPAGWPRDRRAVTASPVRAGPPTVRGRARPRCGLRVASCRPRRPRPRQPPPSGTWPSISTPTCDQLAGRRPSRSGGSAAGAPVDVPEPADRSAASIRCTVEARDRRPAAIATVPSRCCPRAGADLAGIDRLRRPPR